MEFLADNWHLILTVILFAAAGFGWFGKFKADRVIKAVNEVLDVFKAYSEAITDKTISEAEKIKIEKELKEAIAAVKAVFRK